MRRGEKGNTAPPKRLPQFPFSPGSEKMHRMKKPGCARADKAKNDPFMHFRIDKNLGVWCNKSKYTEKSGEKIIPRKGNAMP